MPEIHKSAAKRAARSAKVAAPVTGSSAPASKAALIVSMLERPEGAALADLTAATGWLPHTTRAALTRLRQKGHAIGKVSHEGRTVYSISVVLA